MSVREQLAEALQLWDSDRADRIAALITPLVEQIATERAASELEAAIREDRTTVAKLSPVESLTCFLVKAENLVTRAAVLRSQSHTDKGDQA